MTQSADVLRSHPKQPSTMNAIVACVQACRDCAEACSACADACLAEDQVAQLRECIRLNLDCADVCTATANVVSRLTRPHRVPMKALLAACMESCRTCGDVCNGHAAMHAHCKACAEICQHCETACKALHDAIP